MSGAFCLSASAALIMWALVSSGSYTAREPPITTQNHRAANSHQTSRTARKDEHEKAKGEKDFEGLQTCSALSFAGSDEVAP